MRVKIYGLGWVGKSMYKLFPEAFVVDPERGFYSSEICDVAIISVPTPNLPDGSLDTSIVEEVIREAKERFFIVRSTVNPGTCDRIHRETGKHIVYMPEYLGETVNHPLIDDKQAKFLIIGGETAPRRMAIELFQSVYNANIRIRQTTLMEAEVIKLSENRAILFKVAQAQELYDACEAAGVDYYTVREAVYGDDPRFSLDFTFVYPDKRGANSKCIPKDVLAWRMWAKSVGLEPILTATLLYYNETLINA